MQRVSAMTAPRECRPMEIDLDAPRWTATIHYRSEKGAVSIQYDFEELVELDGIVERGPNFYTISSIDVRINSSRIGHPMTLEDAKRELEGDSAYDA